MSVRDALGGGMSSCGNATVISRGFRVFLFRLVSTLELQAEGGVCDTSGFSALLLRLVLSFPRNFDRATAERCAALAKTSFDESRQADMTPRCISRDAYIMSSTDVKV